VAAVRLEFTPPIEENISALVIAEAASPDGPFNTIDRTTDIGIYPDYISLFTTQNAASITDWFAIAWEDSGGALGELSAPIMGGTDTLVNEIVNRVLIRDQTLNPSVVAEESETVISIVFHTSDPYDLALVDQATYAQKSGIVLLVLSQAYLSDLLVQNRTTSGYTAGMVSEQATSFSSSSSPSLGLIEAMEKRGLKLLGSGTSLVGQIQDCRLKRRIQISGMRTNLDSSRLMAAIANITEDIVLTEIS